jgi:hypothetical protein
MYISFSELHHQYLVVISVAAPPDPDSRILDPTTAIKEGGGLSCPIFSLLTTNITKLKIICIVKQVKKQI